MGHIENEWLMSVRSLGFHPRKQESVRPEAVEQVYGRQQALNFVIFGCMMGFVNAKLGFSAREALQHGPTAWPYGMALRHGGALSKHVDQNVSARRANPALPPGHHPSTPHCALRTQTKCQLLPRPPTFQREETWPGPTFSSYGACKIKNHKSPVLHRVAGRCAVEDLARAASRLTRAEDLRNPGRGHLEGAVNNTPARNCKPGPPLTPLLMHMRILMFIYPFTILMYRN